MAETITPKGHSIAIDSIVSTLTHKTKGADVLVRFKIADDLFIELWWN